MKTITKIGEHTVVKGLSIDDYVFFATGRNDKIHSYDELCMFLEEICEENNGCDPLWDFPREEMEDGTVEDNGCLYVEIYDDFLEPHYFETLIPIENFESVLVDWTK